MSHAQDLYGSANRLPAPFYKAIKSRPSTKFLHRTLAASYDDHVLGTGDRHALRIRNLSGRIFGAETFGNPAAGVNFAKAIPGGESWDITAIRIDLVTSAVAGNRTFRIYIQDSTPRYVWTYEAPINQTAGLTRSYNFVRDGSIEYTAFRSSFFQAPLPDLGRMLAGMRVETAIQGLDAGDQISGIYMMVRRHIDLRLSAGAPDYATNYFTLASDSEAYFGLHYAGLQVIAPVVARQLFHCELDDEVHIVNPSAESTCDIDLFEVA